jgi:putative addiction module component (TIGR02574 family)
MDTKLLDELKPLTTQQKLDIIEFLSESLNDEDVPISDERRMLVRERGEKYKAGETSLHTWEEVKQRTKK